MYAYMSAKSSIKITKQKHSKILIGIMPGKFGTLAKFGMLGKLAMLMCGMTAFATAAFGKSLGLVMPDTSGTVGGRLAMFIMAIFGIPKLGRFPIFNMLENCNIGKASGFTVAELNTGASFSFAQ